MARKRIIDPEFWSDEEIATWSYEARLFYIGLWNFADDEGRLKAHPSLLKSQIFPYDAKVSIEKLMEAVKVKVQWYEDKGLKYGFIHNFLKHQRIDRPTLSKLPTPRALIEDSSSPRGHVLPNTTKDKISKDKGGGAAVIEKIRHLTYVLLEPVQYEKLVARFGQEDADKRIYTLNNYIGSTGRKYKSHYHTILSWADKDERH